MAGRKWLGGKRPVRFRWGDFNCQPDVDREILILDRGLFLGPFLLRGWSYMDSQHQLRYFLPRFLWTQVPLAKVPLDQGSFGQGSFGPRFLQPRFLWTQGSFSQGSFGPRFLWAKVPLVKVPLDQGSFCQVPLDQVPLDQVPLVKVPLTPNPIFSINRKSP